MFVRRPRLPPSAALCRAGCLPQISDVSCLSLPARLVQNTLFYTRRVPTNLSPMERVELFFWIWESQRNNQRPGIVLWVYVPSFSPLLLGVYCLECPQQSLTSVSAAMPDLFPWLCLKKQQYWEQEMILFDESHKIKPGIQFWCWLLLSMLSLFLCDGPFILIHLEMPQEKWMIFW